MKKESVAIVLFAVCVIGLWAWLEFRPQTHHASAQGTPAVVTQGFNALSRGIDGWRTLDWSEIAATVAAMGEQPTPRERFLRESASGEFSAPVRYLRGLILLATNRPAEAWESFSMIAVEEIPPQFLHAPWRLALDEKAGEPNPFAERTLAAVGAGEIAGLNAARVLAFSGDHPAAVAAFLGTDPAEWTAFDLRCFRLLLEDQAVSEDAQIFLSAAWRGGRLPENLRPAFAEMIVRPYMPDAAEMTPRVEALFQENPQLAEAAVLALGSLQEDRKLFMREEFRPLLDRHASQNLPVIDETLMLLVIAASAEEDAEAWTRWSQELRERFPQPEVAEWLQTLAPPNP